MRTTIYMSASGVLGCPKPGHAPYKGTDSWVFGGWGPIPADERREFVRVLKREPTCETCDAEKRRTHNA